MLAMLGVCAALTLKQWKSDLLPLLRVGIVILCGLAALSAITPALNYLTRLAETAGITPYADLLLRALGIALLTQYASEICRECGENGAAAGVEMTGKIEILLLALPLIEEILNLASNLLSMGA